MGYLAEKMFRLQRLNYLIWYVIEMEVSQSKSLIFFFFHTGNQALDFIISLEEIIVGNLSPFQKGLFI